MKLNLGYFCFSVHLPEAAKAPGPGPGQTGARLRLLAGPEARRNPESWIYTQGHLFQSPGGTETQPGLLQGTGTEAEQENRLNSSSTHRVLTLAGPQGGKHLMCWARWVQAEHRAQTPPHSDALQHAVVLMGAF